MQREFGRRIALSRLFEGVTIERVAEELRSHGRGSDREEAIVNLQPEGVGTPLVMVHPIGGSGLCYLELARLLGEEQPVYTIQAQGLDGEMEPRKGIPEMASAYVGHVEQLQPSGPYRLGGWSFGGLVAYEMACALRQAGEEVEFLGIIDSRPPGSFRTPPLEEALHGFAAELGVATTPEEGSLDERLTAIGAAASESGRLALGLDMDRVRSLWGLFVANTEAMAAYAPRGKYDGRVTLFRASTQRAGTVEDAEIWREHTSADVEVVEVAGEHYSLVSQPSVERLARAMRSRLPGLST
jgi:thioesterase domain-containing protein